MGYIGMCRGTGYGFRGSPAILEKGIIFAHVGIVFLV